jgi:hypothetical protein
MGVTESEPGFDLLAPAGARASKEGTRMTTRRFGLGDVITIVGIVFYVAFMLVYIGAYLTDMKKIDFVAFGQLILLALVSMPIAALALSFKNERFLNLQYAFTGFIVLLKLSQVSVFPARGGTEGLDFYVLLGALAIGVGTYLSQVGIWEMKPAGADEPPSSAANLEDRLRELGRIKEAGLITPDEYAKKREEIQDLCATIWQ